MTETWERMTDRERDAWVAQHLFGWRWMLKDGSGGFPKQHVALFPPEKTGRIIFNLDRDAVDVTTTADQYERFSDWPQMVYRDEGDNLANPLRGLPHYTTDPAADYKVLVRVRDDWSYGQRWKYHRELQGILVLRSSVWTVLNYEPGDYSKAAYLAMGGD